MDLENIADTKKRLIAFEDEIAKLYNDGKIKAPIHLAYGNEERLIQIFREVDADDWVFTSYRSHYHALLKGIPQDWLREQILKRRSMFIMDQGYKFISSAIVPGQLPIALGVAMALKRKNSPNKVWAFCGDMAAKTGVYHECVNYAAGHSLPITFTVEDNGWSVDTPTQEVWGDQSLKADIRKYCYERRKYPHHGSGKWIPF